MKKYILITWILAAFVGMGYVNAEDGHDHAPKTKTTAESAQHEDHDENEEEHQHAEEKTEEHGHGDEHEEGEGENPQVGSTKGILQASEENGIQLAPEAEKNFEIQRLKVINSGVLEIPKSAVVTAGLEVNLYRYRAGFYKRIDFDQINRSGEKLSVRSKDLKAGDEVVISGLGFLRIAEIAAFGGAPEGHSH